MKFCGNAFRMIGTGEEKVFSLDMSNEVAADQGMVCGGRDAGLCGGYLSMFGIERRS